LIYLPHGNSRLKCAPANCSTDYFTQPLNIFERADAFNDQLGRFAPRYQRRADELTPRTLASTRAIAELLAVKLNQYWQVAIKNSF
jgi:hypothetical protein